MTQRVAIVIDNLGTWGNTPDEERDQILADLRDEGLDPELVYYYNHPLDIPDTQIDLLVVDFGALTSGWMGNGADDWTDAIIEWAENHPGSLVMLWSGMTADAVGEAYFDRIYKYNKEIENWADWPDNVRALHCGYSRDVDWKVDDGENSKYDGVDWYRDSLTKLQTWFGIDPKRTPFQNRIDETEVVAPK